MDSLVRRIVFGMAAAALALSMSSVVAQSKDPRMGNWKLNLEKSTYSPGPAPKSQTLIFEPAGKGVHVTSDQVNADGSRTATEFTANYDGKDYPLKGSRIADTVSLKRVNALTTIRTDKKDGKVVYTIKAVTSKDGKRFTADVKGKTPKGEPIKNHVVFERP